MKLENFLPILLKRVSLCWSNSTPITPFRYLIPLYLMVVLCGHAAQAQSQYGTTEGLILFTGEKYLLRCHWRLYS